MSRLSSSSLSSKPVRTARLGSCSSGTASSAVVAARGMLTAAPKQPAAKARPVAGGLDAASFEEAMRDPSIRRQFRELEMQASKTSEAEIKATMQDPEIMRQLRELGLEAESAHSPGTATQSTSCISLAHSAYPCKQTVPEFTRTSQSRQLPKARSPEDILEEMLREAERSDSPIQADDGVDGLVRRVAQRLTVDVDGDAMDHGDLEASDQIQSTSQRCRRLQDMLRQELEK